MNKISTQKISFSIWKNFSTIEKSFITYHSLVLLIPGLYATFSNQPSLTFIFNITSIIFVIVIHVLSENIASPFLSALHKYYPVLFYLFIYEQIGKINRIVFSNNIDSILQRADQFLFSSQPSITLSQNFNSVGFSEWMHFSYASFYLSFPLLAFIFDYTKKNNLFESFNTHICITFLCCNFFFIFTPALGPSSLIEFHSQLGGIIFTPLMNFIYQFEISGGAFPSAHVAVTIMVLYFSCHLKRLKYIFWILGLNLILATVYCGYHYGIDAIGGAMLALAVILALKPKLKSENPYPTLETV